MPVRNYHSALNGDALPLKAQVRSMGGCPGFTAAPECIGICYGQGCSCQVLAGVPVAAEPGSVGSEHSGPYLGGIKIIRPCNTLQVGLSLKTVQKLQLVQNAVAHIIAGGCCVWSWLRRASASAVPLPAGLVPGLIQAAGVDL